MVCLPSGPAGPARRLLRGAAPHSSTLPLGAMAPGLLVPPAAVAAFALRRWLPVADGALMARADWRGVAALARMHGVAEQVVADPGVALWAAWLGVVACGARAVLAGGCKGGGALVWALTAPCLPPEGHLFTALTILPIHGLPPLVALAARRRGGGAALPGPRRAAR